MLGCGGDSQHTIFLDGGTVVRKYNGRGGGFTKRSDMVILVGGRKQSVRLTASWSS